MRSIAAVSILSLVLLATPHSAAAQQQQSSPTQASKSRSSHRTLWTIVGIGAGFVGGMLIGMHEFDDAINSSQKVWMSSIAGAAAGGLAGNLLSANQAPTTGFKPLRLPRVSNTEIRRHGDTDVAPSGRRQALSLLPASLRPAAERDNRGPCGSVSPCY